MVFENGVKNIQAAAYNGAHTVCIKALSKKEGPKICLGYTKMVSFSHLAALKKVHPKQMFGPSYFVTALDSL